MKNKELSRLGKRQGVKKRAKERAVRELKKIVESVGVAYDGARFTESNDGGRRQRTTSKRLKDEETVRGIFRGSRRGFGFVERDNGRDIFIPEDKTAGACPG